MKDKFGVFWGWGPFSKKYAGISNIVDHEKYEGIRFDLCVCPAVSAFDIKVPNVTLPSSYHPWLSNEDYSFYSYRYDLEWKDKVYADVSYTRIDKNSILVRTELVNNSSIIKNCVVNYFSSIEYPQDAYTEVSLPEKNDFINAVDYSEYTYNTPRPWDEQNADGRKKGEFFDKRFVSEKGLGDRAEKWHMPHRVILPFGAEKNDRVKYKVQIKNSYENALLAIRYRTSDMFYEQGKQVGVHYINSQNTATFILNGKKVLELTPCDDPEIVFAALGKIPSGAFELSLVSEGTGAAEFDFFAIVEEKDKDKINVSLENVSFVPEYDDSKCDSGYLSVLRYDKIEGSYQLRVFNNDTRFRQIHTGALEDCMTARLSNADETFDDVTESFTGAFQRKHSDNGFFHNAISHTIFVESGKRNVQYAVISKGETDYKSEEEYEELYKKARATAIDLKFNKAGEKYKLSNQILAATVMTNVVYPIYKHGDYIIHHTPGKRWDCLYTWDSGFIGLGMNEYAPAFAEYIIDTYLSEESNKDYAFLHHGSPVPVQIYQLYEMLQSSNDKGRFLAYYDRARLYYLFLRGKIRGSTTAKFKSGLLTTYDYFYSSSGMDDYPAQMAMKADNLRDKAAPVISTSQVIRFGKILSIMADKIGRKADIEEYLKDCADLTEALNKYSWDEESGYYSYVIHDENYEPTHKYVTPEGENLNKGLDGIYPIIAGVCDENQKKKIIGHLTNSKEMHTPFGISAVDMTAGYYKINGYWNGNIWFPHQWFIWKSMLDCGETAFARDIAHLALDIWKREVDESYYTFEMVNTVTGCGGWFHNFGGLSTPINLWARAYYTPGKVNVGFDTYLDKVTFDSENKNAQIDFTYHGTNKKFTLLAVMNDEGEYRAYIDSKPIEVQYRDGLLEIELSADNLSKHKIEIKNIKE